MSTSQGKFIEAVMDVFAQMWSDSSRENIERELRYNAKNALSHGQKILGYRTPADERYEIDPAKAPVIQRIFHDYVDGKPMQQIADELNAQGITTALDRKFTVNGLRSMRKNDKYTGSTSTRTSSFQTICPSSSRETCSTRRRQGLH